MRNAVNGRGFFAHWCIAGVSQDSPFGGFWPEKCGSESRFSAKNDENTCNRTAEVRGSIPLSSTNNRLELLLPLRMRG